MRLQAIVRGEAVRRRTLANFSPRRRRSENGSTETGISGRRELGRARREPMESEIKVGEQDPFISIYLSIVYGADMIAVIFRDDRKLFSL